jgi:hypothetical protein
MGNRVVLVAMIFALAQAEVACEPAGGTSGPGPGTATTGCPIPAPYTVQVSAASDVSSVTVPSGSDADDERAGNAPWCDLTEVSLTKLSVANAVSANGCPASASDTTLPCSPDGMLAALELRPTPINFPELSNRPALVYDLAANPPQEGCELCVLKVYQLRDPRVTGVPNWRWVADASRSTLAGTPIATANVGHFSVFALVELPAPEALQPGAADAAFIVASDFIAEDEGALTVQLSFIDGSIETSRQLERETARLFRFDRFDPISSLDDPACPGTPAEIMTCLFPVETEVRLQLPEDQLVSLGRASDGFRVDFSATVEIL